MNRDSKAAIGAKSLVPFRERLTCSLPEAVQATSISRSTLYNRMKAGELDYRKNGKRRLVMVPSLLKMIDA
jgi:hypothetical protein